VRCVIVRENRSAEAIHVRAGSSSGAFVDVNDAAAILYASNHGRHHQPSLGGPTTRLSTRGRAVRIVHGSLSSAAGV